MPRRTRKPKKPDARKAASGRAADGGVRLHKILAAAGVASLRAAEELIREGRVTVNGTPVDRPGARADPLRDAIAVDGRRIGRPSRPVHYLLHKPRGYVTTTRDPHASRTVMDLLPASSRRARLFPVGRLDAASEGLLLLTNDGALAQVLLHPSFEVPRTYRVSVDGAVNAETLRKLEAGVRIRGRRTAPCRARLLESTRERSVLELELIEGRRRQIRHMLRAVGHPVRRLVRIRFGPLTLRGLRPGEARRLDRSELAALAALAAEARAGSLPG